MPELTRRRLLTSAGAAATAAFAAEFLPRNVRKALASGPPRGSGRLSDIKHVVILMQENRSFDHYFGMLPGVAGFSDPKAITLPDGKPVWYQPTPTTPPAADPTEYTNPDGYLLPFRLNTLTTSAQAIPSTSHAWNYQHLSWDNGAMDGFVTAHLAANGNNGPYTMGYYTREDIPFQWALAENFTICDNYHCSVLGPTWPNRLYHWSASIDPQGVAGGPITSNVDPIPYELEDLPGGADRRRRELAGLPGGRQLRDQPAGDVQELPERAGRTRRCTRAGCAPSRRASSSGMPCTTGCPPCPG